MPRCTLTAPVGRAKGAGSMHNPSNIGKIDGWEFRRCRCGFMLALPPARNTIYWLRARNPIRRLASKAELAAALETHCRYAPQPTKAESGARRAD
ncbi:MAG: hypothetical protein ACRD19_02325 [Terriglobia bacterium]